MKCPENPRRTLYKKPANPRPERLRDTSDTSKGYIGRMTEKPMDAELLEKARAIWRGAMSKCESAKPAEATKRGITVADVLRVFPGARILTDQEAKALTTSLAEVTQKRTPAPSTGAAPEGPQQLRLIQGGKR